MRASKISSADQHIVALFTGAKMAIAGLFSFLLVNFFNLPESIWCMVTIAAVTQMGFNQTITKAFMRAIGTLIGSVIGLSIAWFSNSNPFLIITLIFIIIYLTSLIALQNTVYSYASIICGITVAIIVFFSMENQNFINIARDRTIEVLIGIFILGCTNLALLFFAKHYSPNNITNTNVAWTKPKFALYSQYSIPAFKIGLACVTTFLIWYFFKLPQGYWATITCLLIMEEHHGHTLKKAIFRFFAHIIAAILGFIFIAFLIKAPYFWRLIPLIITFFLSGFLIGLNNKYSNMGNTLAIAVCIMLLTTPHIHQSFEAISIRLMNVILGIIIAYAILFTPNFFLKKIKKSELVI